MIATFRETAKSLQDLKYGTQILKKTAGQCLWYWSQYLLLFLIVSCVLGLGILVYYTPQLPKLATDNLPDLTLTVKNGKASTNVPEPFVRGDDNFTFIIDTKGTVTNLDKYKTGLLLTADKFIAKSENETRIMELKDVENFTGSRSTIVSWLKSHQPNILIFGLVALMIVAAIGLGFYWLWNVLTFALWAVALMFGAKTLKKSLSYVDAFKIVVYASVPALLIHLVGFFFPGSFLGLFALGIFLFYVYSWTKNLNLSKK